MAAVKRLQHTVVLRVLPCETELEVNAAGQTDHIVFIRRPSAAPYSIFLLLSIHSVCVYRDMSVHRGMYEVSGSLLK